MSSLPKPIGSVAGQKIYHSNTDPPLFFIMMRLNVKVALLLLTTIGFITVLILWSVCGKEPKNPQEWHRSGKFNNPERLAELQGAEELDCDINGEYIISCRKEGDEVYLPFSFLYKYFEVYGKLATYDGLERFEWSHSYSKVYHPKGKYDPRGVFMYFENYNVEVRERVKCVSATEGVPISTQWESQGYYYPTQIAQFGLSHYSKNLTEPEPRRKIIEDGEKEMAKWLIPAAGSVERVYDKAAGSKVLKFKTGEQYSDAVKLKMEHVLDFIMSLNILLSGNSSFSVVLQNRETREIYNLHYITSDILITAQDNNVYHGIGTTQEWKKLTRDLIIDLQKGLNYLDRDKSKHKIPRSKLKIITVSLRGYGSVDNLTLSSSEHIQQFYDAAEWFVRHQDAETGGWPIPVRRKLASGFHDLQPGWLSAMGQGHAISVLARAYHHSGGDARYLEAAVAGLRPFQVASGKGGVLATFLNKYHWYEEYPTKPASFVLNGFIYALLGLYDLMTIAPPGRADEAEFLFREGMISLKGMLLFYDMGSVTAYDLRHVSLGIAPNLARNNSVSPMNQLLMALRFYSTGTHLQCIADFAGVDVSTCCRIIKKVSAAIARLRPQYIKFPSNIEEIRRTQNDFYNIARFPRVIGAIDGTHIRIQSPGGDDAEVYRNRKNYFSLNVQAICNAQMEIIDLVARWPGSTHDATIFNSCNKKSDFDDNMYPNCIMLGDSAYNLREYLFTPLQNPVNQREHLYNESHIRTRGIIEKMFGVWKRRFPVLAYGCRLQIQNVLTVIVATAVLHNIARRMREEEPPLPEELDEHILQQLIADGQVPEIQNHNEPQVLDARRILINNYFAHL